MSPFDSMTLSVSFKNRVSWLIMGMFGVSGCKLVLVIKEINFRGKKLISCENYFFAPTKLNFRKIFQNRLYPKLNFSCFSLFFCYYVNSGKDVWYWEDDYLYFLFLYKAYNTAQWFNFESIKSSLHKQKNSWIFNW